MDDVTNQMIECEEVHRFRIPFSCLSLHWPFQVLQYLYSGGRSAGFYQCVYLLVIKTYQNLYISYYEKKMFNWIQNFLRTDSKIEIPQPIL